MVIGPNENGAELYREHLESLPCPTCGAKESDFKFFRIDRDKLVEMLQNELQTQIHEGKADFDQVIDIDLFCLADAIIKYFKEK